MVDEPGEHRRFRVTRIDLERAVIRGRRVRPGRTRFEEASLRQPRIRMLIVVVCSYSSSAASARPSRSSARAW